MWSLGFSTMLILMSVNWALQSFPAWTALLSPALRHWPGASSKRRNRAGDGEYPRHAPGFQGMPFQSLTIKNNAS